MADWQAGDLALCVNASEISASIGTASCRPELRVGGVYTVSGVGVDGTYSFAWPVLYLRDIKSPASHGGFAVERFRKIAPHAPDAEDYVTIALLNGQSVPVVA